MLRAQNGSVSPLHHAVLGNRVEVVKYLLSLPAVDPNVGDGVCLWHLTVSALHVVQFSASALQMGATPLHYAARSGFADIVRAFLACSRVDRHSSLGVSRSPETLLSRQYLLWATLVLVSPGWIHGAGHRGEAWAQGGSCIVQGGVRVLT